MKNYNSAFAMINMMTTMYMWMFSLCTSLSAAEFGWVSPKKGIKTMKHYFQELVRENFRFGRM